MCNADKIYSSEYSFGESIMLLQHRRKRNSADIVEAKLTQCHVPPCYYWVRGFSDK